MSRQPRAYLLVGVGAALFALGWMPTGLAPVIPLGALLIIRGFRHIERTREILVCAVVAAFAFEGLASHFLLVLTRYSWVAFVLYPMTIAYYVVGWLALFWGAAKLERWGRLPRPLGLTLLYPLVEWTRTTSDASFPADVLAHAFGTNPSWLSWTPWTGPFGVSLLAWGVGALLDRAIEQRANRTAAAGIAALALALWLAPPLTDRMAAVRDPGGESGNTGLRVGIVQPVVDVRDKLNRERWPVLWERLEQLTLTAASGADLVIWPETSRPGPLIWRDDEPLRDPAMEALAMRAGVPILYGTEIARIRDGRVGEIYNGAALVRPGLTEDWYGKQRLLPFVEGIPFAEWIGWDPSGRQDRPQDRSLLTLMGNFKRGPRPTVFEVGSARIGVLVCYEAQYPDLGRRLREAGANTLAVITNDAWWGRSIFAPWHARMVASPARSLDVPVVRAANSGVSSLTDRSGRARAATSLDRETTLRIRLVPGSDDATFYSRHGDLVLVGIVVLLVVLAGAFRFRGR